MKRKAYDKLQQLDKLENKACIVIEGGVGVGKTSLLFEYVKTNYETSIYLDAADRPDFRAFIASADKQQPLKSIIFRYLDIDETADIMIPVIIDNADASKELIGLLDSLQSPINMKLFLSVNYFYPFKDKDEIAVLKLYPLDFEEFLAALNHDWYAEVIRGHFENRKKIPDMIHNELLDLFEVYMNTGGMPAVVNEYIRYDSISYLGGIKKCTKDSILKSVYDCCELEESTNINQSAARGIVDAVLKTYHKKNRKFMYTLIRKGVTDKMYRECVDFLCREGILLMQHRLVVAEDGLMPDDNSFRLYCSDTGLVNMDRHEYVLMEDAAEEFDKALVENFLILEFRSKGIESGYWESGTGASVDFCIKSDFGYIPLQIKMPGFKNSVSSMNFYNKMHSKLLIKINTGNYSFTDETWNIPIYCVGVLENINK